MAERLAAEELALIEDGFQARPSVRGRRVWEHPNLPSLPGEADVGLSTAEALNIRSRWEAELHKDARSLGYLLDVKFEPGHGRSGSREWHATLSPESPPRLRDRTAGQIEGRGPTPLSAARAALDKATWA